ENHSIITTVSFALDFFCFVSLPTKTNIQTNNKRRWGSANFSQYSNSSIAHFSLTYRFEPMEPMFQWTRWRFSESASLYQLFRFYDPWSNSVASRTARVSGSCDFQ